MDLCVLVAYLPDKHVGGAEVQAFILARELSKTHCVTLLARAKGWSPLPRSSMRGTLTIRERPNLGIPGVRFIFDAWATLSAIRRLERRPDLIIAYQTGAEAWIAVLAEKLYGVPFVLFVMGGRDYFLSQFPRSRRLTPMILRHASGVFVQSPTIKKVLLRELERAGEVRLAAEIEPRIRIVRNGVALGVARAKPAADELLYVGRLIRIKGVHHLLEALKLLPDQRLIVIGDGDEADALREQARDLRVTFLGQLPHDEVQRYYGRAKALILPSITQEGFPNCIMEAMAWGVPVIASDVGGVSDIVEHGKTGFLTTPGDAEAIARHVRALSGDPDLRERMREHCWTTIQHYAWERVVPDAEAAILSVLAADRRAEGA